MSDLRPKGVPVSFAGRDWHFLFTFRVVDELQSRYPGRSIFDVVNAAREDTLDGLLKLIDVIDVLCDGQISRDEIPKALKVNTLTGKGSLEEVRLAVNLALIQSMPIPDESDEGASRGNGIMEIPKFIVIATAKFHFSEREAWEMTPRKFSLLNDAYRAVNGLKKEEEYASLLSLP